MDEENIAPQPTSSAPIKPKNNKLLLIVIGILVIIVIIALAYLLGKRNSNTTTVDETSPTIESTVSASSNTEPGAPALVSATISTDPTLGWKTYTNATYGFSFKYPGNVPPEINSDPSTNFTDVSLGNLVNSELLNFNVTIQPLSGLSFMYGVNANSLSDFIHQASTGSRKSFSDVQSVNIGGLNGYSAISQAGSSVDSYFFQKGNYIYMINDQNAWQGPNSGIAVNPDPMLSTFQFTK